MSDLQAGTSSMPDAGRSSRVAADIAVRQECPRFERGQCPNVPNRTLSAGQNVAWSSRTCHSQAFESVLKGHFDLPIYLPSRMTPLNSPLTQRPEVIVDFAVEEGLLTVALKNVGFTSAYGVRTIFDKPFRGLGGEKSISGMRVFRRVDFMPPHKEYRQFIDRLQAYAKRKEPMQIQATVSYRDRDGNRYQETIMHDLRIFLELGQAKLT
jgi:hypothetical protein